MSDRRSGTATTAYASRYLQQLCKHWAHKFDVKFDSERGSVILPVGRVELVASPTQLEVTLFPQSKETLDRLQSVVEDHLNRFAFREAPLPFTWHDGEISS